MMALAFSRSVVVRALKRMVRALDERTGDDSGK